MTHKLLGEMTDAEIGALVRAHQSGKEIEYFNRAGNWGGCGSYPAWNIKTAYRIAPEPTQQAVIPWSIFNGDVIAVAMDQNGKWFAYLTRPKCAYVCWSSACKFFSIDHLKFDRGNEPDWRNTLQMRPGYEVTL